MTIASRPPRCPFKVYSACTPCATEWLLHADEYAPGRWMGIAHASHAPEMIAVGWIGTDYPHEPPDVVCPHYAALCAEDGDGEDPGETRADTEGDMTDCSPPAAT